MPYDSNDYSSSLIEQYALPTAVAHNTKPTGTTVNGIMSILLATATAVIFVLMWLVTAKIL